MLVEETIAGCRESYDELFARYRSQVLAMLTLRCGADQAQDIMQEAFIKGFLNIEKFDNHFSFGGWIFTIARNLAIDYSRRKRGNALEICPETPSSLPDPEQSVIQRQFRSKIENIIRKMPANYRIVFELRYIEELSYEEIATQLGMPIGTVKTQIHRVREKFVRGISE
ncbi:RNA polymerase sigma factor SigW [Mucinivorans hirudinis]|uniref:RNA polymerase sigma factor SigW n=1 Tax=Mucinivorans hirudinis TaxID=1433126 RepID=A0A060R9C1_9BACT|nr:RNA polymerase sigma factor SigW [Mucinivorans hirudinis]